MYKISNTGEDLFKKIQSLREQIPEQEQKEMAAAIIDVMREHRLTYDQCFEVLRVVDLTLERMSRALML